VTSGLEQELTELNRTIREALDQLPRSVPTLRRYFNSVVTTGHAGVSRCPTGFSLLHLSLFLFQVLTDIHPVVADCH